MSCLKQVFTQEIKILHDFVLTGNDRSCVPLGINQTVSLWNTTGDFYFGNLTKIQLQTFILDPAVSSFFISVADRLTCIMERATETNPKIKM